MAGFCAILTAGLISSSDEDDSLEEAALDFLTGLFRTFCGDLTEGFFPPRMKNHRCLSLSELVVLRQL